MKNNANSIKKIRFVSLGVATILALPLVMIAASCNESSKDGSEPSCYGKKVHTGPRGGTYTISSGGNKEYCGNNGS